MKQKQKVQQNVDQSIQQIDSMENLLSKLQLSHVEVRKRLKVIKDNLIRINECLDNEVDDLDVRTRTHIR